MCISIYISILYEQGLFIYDHLRVRVYAVYACNTYSGYTYIHTYMLLSLYHNKCTHVRECRYLNTQGVGSVPGHSLLTWGLHWDTRVWPR